MLPRSRGKAQKKLKLISKDSSTPHILDSALIRGLLPAILVTGNLYVRLAVFIFHKSLIGEFYRNKGLQFTPVFYGDHRL
jgi:hypothetical protein